MSEASSDVYRRSGTIELFNSIFARFFPSIVTRIRLTPSIEGREVSAVRLRAGRPGVRRGVLLVGGIHARELINPDLLIELVARLLLSYRTGSDIVLGARRWAANDVRIMLETLEIYILANANPDGREYVLDGERMWRKNRRKNSGTTCDGVDLNRNFDLLWGIETIATSRSPCSHEFVGSEAFSEPETRNVRHLLENYRIECLVDVHSFSELILYPWGHAPNQTTDPTQSFALVDTSGWNRLPADAPGYREYVPTRDLQRFQQVGQDAAEAIRAVRGRSYAVQSGNDLYATTGTFSSYAYSRHVADPNKRKVYGFTFETGPWTGSICESFQPDEPALTRIKEEATSGLLSVVQSCICAIDLIGSDLFGADSDTLAAMRSIRDLRLSATPAGLRWVKMFERHQAELALLLTNDQNLWNAAARVIEAVGNLLRSEDSVSSEDAEQAFQVIDRIGQKECSSELRDDLERVRRVAAGVIGRTPSEIIEELTRN